jgi:hypothetical protein
MQVRDPGHSYLLDCYGKEMMQLLLIFMKREGEGYPGNVGEYPGTNCQQVICALINRFQYLNHQVPCEEDEELINLGRRMLWLLEKRSADRKGMAEELKMKMMNGVGIGGIESYPTCGQCGHIVCGHNIKQPRPSSL